MLPGPGGPREPHGAEVRARLRRGAGGLHRDLELPEGAEGVAAGGGGGGLGASGACPGCPGAQQMEGPLGRRGEGEKGC